MRILSLLPSASEIVDLLGLADSLVGVSHECDWSPQAQKIRRVSSSCPPVGSTPTEIDRIVSESTNSGAPTHGLETGLVRELAPDLVLTQDLCAVCAVPAGHLRSAIGVLGIEAEVLSLDPSSHEETLAGIDHVGKATGNEQRAGETIEAFLCSR